MLDKLKDKVKEKLSGDSKPTQQPQPTPEAVAHTEGALDHVTDQAANHSEDPTNHLHKAADHPASHSWLASYYPSSEYVGNLEAGHHLGNWVRMNRTTNEKEWEAMSIYVRLGMHALYYGKWQESLLETGRVEKMLQAQSEKMGKQYDDPASCDHIRPFIQSFKLDMNEMVEPNPDNRSVYPTFNEFFAREIKPSARPPALPEDPSCISSAADCRLTVWPSVSLATEFWVKGANFTLGRLFQDEELAGQFDGGSMAIYRLAPQDYHRWHAPVSGKIVSTKEIPGAYFTVNPMAIGQKGKLNVYCENRRSVMVVEAMGPRGQTIPVVIVAVGAMLVGSIKYIKNTPGEELKRGECIGKFLYGGSTVLVFFPRRTVTFDDDLVAWSTGKAQGAKGPMETLVKVGEKIGNWN